jgi:2-polyprenyl-6-methoxyphenol hydroxylase-like FAD-dependent oxidoreductase
LLLNSVPEDLGETVTIKLNNGQTVVSPLLIAADGANSKVREISGIECIKKDYEQTSIVATVELSTEVCNINRYIP